MRKLVIPKHFGRPSIGLALFGCTNRPFYHVCVFPDRALGRRSESSILEQVGTFDPLPNVRNEKLVALDYGRLKYWIGERNAHISVPVLELLGLSGLFPIHPKTFIRARESRELQAASAAAVAVAAQATEAEQGDKAQAWSISMLSSYRYDLLSTRALLVLLLFAFSHISLTAADCYDDVQVYARNSSSTTRDESLYTIEKDTRACFSLLSSVGVAENGGGEELPGCSPAHMQLTLAPITVHPNTNTLPYITLNMSVLVHARVSSVFVRLECVNAPDHADSYCHDHSKQLREWGRMIWPCRALSLRQQGDGVELPLRFGYSCFRLFGLSQYRVNVTLMPQRCRSSFMVSIPHDSQLDTAIASLYTQELNASALGWSPLLYAETTCEDGVWLRVSNSAGHESRQVAVAVYGRADDGELQYVRTFHIEQPADGVKWEEVPSGEYLALAYVPRHDCELTCEGREGVCTLCAHTRLSLSISGHRAGVAWRGLRAMYDASGWMVGGMAGVSLLLLVLAALYWAWLRGRCCWGGAAGTPRRERHMELVHRPTVLVLYSDESAMHCAAAREWAAVLRRAGNARVLIDEDECLRAGVRPSRWLVECLVSCERVLVVLSPASEGLLDGRKLKQTRPLPDLWTAGVEMLIGEVAKQPSSAPARFGLLRLPYSGKVPKRLALLGLRTFDVMGGGGGEGAGLGSLVAWLHGVCAGGGASCEADMGGVETAVRGVEREMEEDGGREAWLEKSWTDEDNHSHKMSLPALPCIAAVRVLSDKEKAEMADRLGLLPPDEDDQVSTTDPRFALLPPDSSDEDDK